MITSLRVSQHLFKTSVIQMRYRNPGLKHFVSSALTCTNPLVWIQVESILALLS
jgi:hypothetical protein